MRRKQTLIIIAIFFLFLNGCTNEKSSYEKYVDAINSIDANIYMYGEEITFDYQLDYTFIGNLSECQIDSDTTFNYLIISANIDFTLDEDDIVQLKSLIKNDYKVIYVGLSYIFPLLIDDKESFGFARDNYDDTYMYFYDPVKTLALNSSQDDEYHIVYFIASSLQYYDE